MSINEVFLLTAGIVMGVTVGALAMREVLVNRFKESIQFWSKQIEVAQENTAKQIQRREAAEKETKECQTRMAVGQREVQELKFWAASNETMLGSYRRVNDKLREEIKELKKTNNHG